MVIISTIGMDTGKKQDVLSVWMKNILEMKLPLPEVLNLLSLVIAFNNS